MSVDFIEPHELDDYFARLEESLEEVAEEDNESGREVEWWLSEIPTLPLAEAELLLKSEELKLLNKEDFISLNEYIIKCTQLDHAIMMLEMTVDEHYKDWTPTGAKLSEFRVGTIFRACGGRFLCTDVGQRTVIAIRYTPRDPKNMDGPPYFLAEHVFAEFDIEGVDILS